MTTAPSFGGRLAIALILFIVLAIGVSLAGRLPIRRELLIAAIRAVVQLAAVSFVITTVMARPWSSVLFAAGMFGVAVATGSGRGGARHNWPWVAVALAAGTLPVLTIVFGLEVSPFVGPAIIPIAGIIIGGSMTAHTLTARRAFAAIRADRGQIEAGLALGLIRRQAITNVIERHSPEALMPILDQTRTVGLVTLPGAFVGVLLGGGSAAEAAASQLLVLIGLLAAEASVTVATQRLIADGKILPLDVRTILPAA